MKLLSNVVAFCRDVFNWKLALVSGIFQGVMVALINWDHGIIEYLRAGGSQAPVSALLTGVTAGVAQLISCKIQKPLPAYFWGSAVPAAMTLVFVALAHFLNGTPEFLWSCFAPTALSGSTSLFVNLAARNLAHRSGWQWTRKFLLNNNRSKH
ncbi:MAG TPA: hypothetical protein VJG64_04255 [Candidatus Paceibacterota bacterium]